jgi:hypothetical protein
MGLWESFKAVFSKLGQSPHDFRPTLSTFNNIDVESVKRRLDLEREAEERGKRSEPNSSSSSFDEIENRIIEAVEHEKADSKQEFSDLQKIYSKRLLELDFQGELREVNHLLEQASVTYSQVTGTGADKLHSKRRHLKEVEKYLDEFRIGNLLKRVCDRPSPNSRILYIGIIAVIGLVETIGNTSFLAKGNQLGFLGAFVEAIAISFVNLGFAFLCARMATNFNHIAIARKVVGTFFFIAFLVVLVALNLIVAHYREVTGSLLNEGGRLALSAFYENPLALMEFQSWILFGMGFLFGLISFADGIKWDDPYPGYGKIESKVSKARNEYAREREDQDDLLGQVFSEKNNELRQVGSVIGQLRQENLDILDARSLLAEHFEEHLGHLERSGNALLSYYREVNERHRSDAAPKRFAKSWTMERPSTAVVHASGHLSDEAIAKFVEEADVKILSALDELKKKFDENLLVFRQLDQLVPDEISLGDTK